MHQRVSLITLGVEDASKARAFHERLGWKASSASMDDIAFFRVGSLGFALYPQQDVAEDLGLSDAPRPGGMTLACNVESEALVD
ncbi:MAG: hypothetical protein R3F54_31990 [Alphaproteobacteria bacterium]